MSNEGGLEVSDRSSAALAAVKRDVDMVRRLTSRPFAINTSRKPLTPRRSLYAGGKA